MYQNAQKDTFNYSYNAPTTIASYLGPHEVYPNPFPYQMMYQQCLKPSYNIPLTAEQREMYLPKTLPVGESNFNHCPSSSLDSRNLEGHAQETFDVWNNTFAREMKSVPKFDSLLDIDRLEQLCYDDVDNCPSSTYEKSKENRMRRTTDDKNAQPSSKDISNTSFERTSEKSSPGPKISSKLSSASPGIGTRPKEITAVNAKILKQIPSTAKVA